MLTTFYPPYHFGGDAIYVRALARGLAQLGHEVHVVHCEDAYRLKGEPEVGMSAAADDLVQVHSLRSRFGFLSPLLSQQTGRPALKGPALKKIFSERFDVIHYHNISLMGGPAVLAWGRARVKLYTLHEHWLICPTHVFWKNNRKVCDRPTCMTCCLRSGIPPQLWRYTPLRERALDGVDLLLSPSRFTAERHEAFGVAAEIRVLPLFSDLDPGPLNGGEEQDAACFAYVGRVTASKGIVELLRVFAQLPEYLLLVVGAGDLLSALRDEYSDHGNIRFLGKLPQRELVKIYQSATAVILPSLVPETFGLTVVEALASSAPVVVRDYGGSPEIVDRAGAGFVYRTSTELKEILRRLVDNPTLVTSLRHKARDAFERYYSRQRHMESYLSIIDSLLGSQSKA